MAWQAGADMLADPLTKAGPSREELREVMKTGNCGIVFKKR